MYIVYKIYFTIYYLVFLRPFGDLNAWGSKILLVYVYLFIYCNTKEQYVC